MENVLKKISDLEGHTEFLVAQIDQEKSHHQEREGIMEGRAKGLEAALQDNERQREALQASVDSVREELDKEREIVKAKEELVSERERAFAALQGEKETGKRGPEPQR